MNDTATAMRDKWGLMWGVMFSDRGRSIWGELKLPIKRPMFL